MFGLGVWEFALILVVALLVLGPERLPKVARTLGRGMREMRKAMSDFQSNLATVDIEEERERNRNRFPPPTQPSGATFIPSESDLSTAEPKVPTETEQSPKDVPASDEEPRSE